MAEVICPPSLRMHTVNKFDGSAWRNYESPDSLITITGGGRELAANGGLAFILRQYAEDTVDDLETPTRQFLAEGGNAKVFTVGGKRLVVKEAKMDGDQLLPAIDRMDLLLHAIEHHCPRWIDIPMHYGVLILKKDPSKQYLLIEKIDDGVTVGDIVNYHVDPARVEPLIKGEPELPKREEHIRESVRRIFGEPTKELKNEINGRYEALKGLVRKALIAEYRSPDEFLPDLDYNPYNVLVDRVASPIAGSRHKFWIIDQ